MDIMGNTSPHMTKLLSYLLVQDLVLFILRLEDSIKFRPRINNKMKIVIDRILVIGGVTPYFTFFLMHMMNMQETCPHTTRQTHASPTRGGWGQNLTLIVRLLA